MKSQYPIPKSFYLQSALRVSIVKSLWYSARFRGRVIVGRGSRLLINRSARVTMTPGAMLMIGMAHDSGAGSVLRLQPRSTFAVEGRVQLMRASQISVGWDARLAIGDGTFLNDGASVVCDERVTIGTNCAISWGARIMDTDVHRLVRSGVAGNHRAPVTIGNHCWIGAGAMILKGTVLGDDCVVAAGSVVTRQAGAAELLVGTPATARARDITWQH